MLNISEVAEAHVLAIVDGPYPSTPPKSMLSTNWGKIQFLVLAMSFALAFRVHYRSFKHVSGEGFWKPTARGKDTTVITVLYQLDYLLP